MSFEDVIFSSYRGSATNRYHLDIAELVAKNVHRYQTSESLKNRVA